MFQGSSASPSTANRRPGLGERSHDDQAPAGILSVQVAAAPMVTPEALKIGLPAMGQTAIPSEAQSRSTPSDATPETKKAGAEAAAPMVTPEALKIGLETMEPTAILSAAQNGSAPSDATSDRKKASADAAANLDLSPALAPPSTRHTSTQEPTREDQRLSELAGLAGAPASTVRPDMLGIPDIQPASNHGNAAAGNTPSKQAPADPAANPDAALSGRNPLPDELNRPTSTGSTATRPDASEPAAPQLAFAARLIPDNQAPATAESEAQPKTGHAIESKAAGSPAVAGATQIAARQMPESGTSGGGLKDQQRDAQGELFVAEHEPGSSVAQRKEDPMPQPVEESGTRATNSVPTPGAVAEPGTARPAPNGERLPETSAWHTAMESVAPPPRASHDVSLQLSEGASRVEIRMVERAGEIRVTVHTPDQELANSMRNDLPDLVGKLRQGGFQAEAWHTPAPRQASADRHAGSESFQQETAGGRRDSRQQQSPQKNQSRWAGVWNASLDPAQEASK